ncbi:MAG: GNAT family N-acetyltransferase [Synergistaceae bacterium]|nr:GNAT family N-acetyltransferase [Synergistaceae bacterium]
MIIRIAEEKDLPEILALYLLVENDDKILTVDDARVIFNKMRSYPDYNVYVAEVDGKIAGTFALAIMDNLAHMGSKSGLIEDVVVAESFQGQGIGKQMMMFAVEICKGKSCYKVALSSNLKRKDAHKFYEKIGFKIHGYSFTMELEDSLLS